MKTLERITLWLLVILLMVKTSLLEDRCNELAKANLSTMKCVSTLQDVVAGCQDIQMSQIKVLKAFADRLDFTENNQRALFYRWDSRDWTTNIVVTNRFLFHADTRDGRVTGEVPAYWIKTNSYSK